MRERPEADEGSDGERETNRKEQKAKRASEQIDERRTHARSVLGTTASVLRSPKSNFGSPVGGAGKAGVVVAGCVPGVERCSRRDSIGRVRIAACAREEGRTQSFLPRIVLFDV
jgi:hypothetical protein